MIQNDIFYIIEEFIKDDEFGVFWISIS